MTTTLLGFLPEVIAVSAAINAVAPTSRLGFFGRVIETLALAIYRGRNESEKDPK